MKHGHLTSPVANYVSLMDTARRVLDRERKKHMLDGVAIIFVHAHSNAFGVCPKSHRAGKSKKLQHER
jgi:hypothetical protein